MIQVEIITIGDELLIGQVIDTNSTWMAQELNKIGFDVQYKTTVGDVEMDILNAFELAFSRVSIVLVTGGIGPTKDDITKKTLCKFFNDTLVFDNSVLQNIENLFSANNRPLNELTRNQSYVPESCVVIQNKMGTAPITWFEKEGKILVSMPGVPFEMKWIMSHEILNRLASYFKQTDSIQHQTFCVSNYSESLLATHLESFETELPDNLKLAYLPAYGLIRLRITGKHPEESFLSKQMKEQGEKLIALLDQNIFAQVDEALEILLGKMLKENGLTLSLAESCTGGKIANLITTVPGSSTYFKGGVVAYSNEAKQNTLSVNASDLDQYGAVSEPVVIQMAKGAQHVFQTDCAIATSGIAGPDGGTEEKPVGTVWIAVAYRDLTVSRKYIFSKNRENNILRSANTGMLMLLDLLKSDGLNR